MDFKSQMQLQLYLWNELRPNLKARRYQVLAQRRAQLPSKMRLILLSVLLVMFITHQGECKKSHHSSGTLEDDENLEYENCIKEGLKNLGKFGSAFPNDKGGKNPLELGIFRSKSIKELALKCASKTDEDNAAERTSGEEPGLFFGLFPSLFSFENNSSPVGYIPFEYNYSRPGGDTDLEENNSRPPGNLHNTLRPVRDHIPLVDELYTSGESTTTIKPGESVDTVTTKHETTTSSKHDHISATTVSTVPKICIPRGENNCKVEADCCKPTRPAKNGTLLYARCRKWGINMVYDSRSAIGDCIGGNGNLCVHTIIKEKCPWVDVDYLRRWGETCKRDVDCAGGLECKQNGTVSASPNIQNREISMACSKANMTEVSIIAALKKSGIFKEHRDAEDWDGYRFSGCRSS